MTENSEDLEYIASVKEKLSKINHGVDPQVLNLLYADYLQEDDAESKEEQRSFIEEILRWHLPDLALSKKPLLSAPSPEDCCGDLIVGTVTQGEEQLWDFAIPMQELNQGHILVASRSGHGKTTLLMSFVRQLLDTDTPFLITDYKRDFRSLTALYPQLVILSRKNLKVNMLKAPPGVPIEEWKQLFMNIFGHVEGVWSGSTQFLLQYLDRVYAEKGEKATIKDLLEKLETDAPNLRRMQDYWSAVYTRIYGLHSKLGSMLECREGLNIEQLLTRPVVLELDGFGGYEDQNLLVLFFFYWIYSYRKVHRHRGLARHWIIIDEAKRVFPASEQYSSTTREYSHIAPSDLIVDEIRDFSEILLAADNEVTKLSNSIISQSYAKIVGNVSGRDLDVIAEAMNLSDDEKECVSQLERGEWIVKLASRYTKPFTIKTEDFPVEKNVSDEEVEQRMEPLLSDLVAKPMNNEIATKETEGSAAYQDNTSQTNARKITFPAISEDTWDLLLDVNKHPFRGLAGRYESLSLSGRRASFAKAELIEKGLAREFSVVLGSHRPVKFLVLTDMAINSLESVGHDVRLWKHTQGKFQHQLYTVLIAYTFRKAGFQTYIEKTLKNGRRVDVLTILNGKKVAVEVETGVSINMDEEMKALEEVDELIVVTDEQTNLRMLRNAVKNSLSEKVQVFHISDYLRHLKTQYRAENGGRKANNSHNPNPDSSSENKDGNKGK
ncbi:MAG: DUF87 domain-containing protein [Candidatus Bathyarchaeota archaeon]|nr:DUF87 domain-containing protein [Candidatus Bathyarchaeota archaeon]